MRLPISRPVSRSTTPAAPTIATFPMAVTRQSPLRYPCRYHTSLPVLRSSAAGMLRPFGTISLSPTTTR